MESFSFHLACATYLSRGQSRLYMRTTNQPAVNEKINRKAVTYKNCLINALLLTPPAFYENIKISRGWRRDQYDIFPWCERLQVEARRITIEAKNMANLAFYRSLWATSFLCQLQVKDLVKRRKISIGVRKSRHHFLHSDRYISAEF